MVLVVCLVSAGVMSACSRNVEQLKREYVDRGDRYMSDRNVEAAIIEYRNAIQQDPRFGEAYRKLTVAYVTQGSGVDALRAALAAADLLPDVEDAQMEAAGLLLLAGNFEDAKGRAERMLAKNPNNVNARVLLGNATAGLKDIDTAIKEFEEAIRLDPRHSGIYAGLATLKASQGDKVAAEQTFKQAIEVNPKSVVARLALAQFYWSDNRLDLAERLMQEAHEIDPTDTRVNLTLAVFYQSTRRSPQAEPYLRAAAASSTDQRLKVALADYYIAQQRREEAVQLLEPLTKDRKFAPLASVRLAGIAQLEGRVSDAMAIVDRVLDLEPKNATTLAAKSDLLRQQNKLDDASKMADAAVAANAMSAEAQFVRGRILRQKGDFAAAENAFNQVLRLNPRVAAARVELAQLRIRDGAEDAVSVAAAAAKADPARLDGKLTLARAHMQRKDFTAAQIVLDEALRLAPKAAAVHAQMGTLLAMQRDTAGARAAFNRALELDGVQLEALTGLTGLDFANGKRQEGLTRLDAAVERAPHNVGLLLLAANAHASSSSFARAETLLLSVLTTDTTNLTAYSLLGRVYLAQRKLDEAKAQFTKLAERPDRRVPALTLVGIIEMLQNRPREAQQTFERVMTVDPKAGVAANNLAWLYLENGGSAVAALQLAETARTVLPNAPQVHDTLGWAHYKNGSTTQAISALRHSLDLDPKSATTVYHLALAYERSGDQREARAAMTRYLELDPSSDRSADVKRRLQSLGT
jgi:tetratricopeptide (TPR) repeat protein